VRTLFLLIAATALCSCVSRPDRGTWRTDITEGTQKVASATVRGAEVTAEVVGESMGTAYRGMKTGYAQPDQGAYGPRPGNYVIDIRRHMLRFEGVKATASFQFGQPVRAYLNKGLMRGGDVEWQGWVVDVEIQTKTALGQPDVARYVVRMKDGEIVEVIEKAYASAFQRVPVDPPPVPAAPRD
jgi:hypothetical protein